VATPQVYGVRETLAEIKKIDQNLYWESIKEMKSATKPLSAAINLEFSYGAPLSGMIHEGRTGWRGTKTITRVGGRKPKNKEEWGLVKVTLLGTMATIADMAGNSNNGVTTREYDWKGKKRSHKVNGQGTAMIQNLGGSPSRYVWPVADSFLPMTTRAILAAIESTSKIVNKNLVLRKQ
jgi:hypothetical protein